MDEKFDFFNIVFLIWISGTLYGGLMIYKQYVKSNPDPTQQSQEVDSAALNPYSLDRKWGKRADQINRDHRSLVETYKQRQRDQRRITAGMMRRR